MTGSLQSFIHVSSAYANCPEKHIEERFYSVPLQCDAAIQMVELFQEDVLNFVTPMYVWRS
jgi:fatty acyl-CoA reductase